MGTATLARLQQRGTKRVCKSCEQRFYDLGRDPIVCPLCHAALPAAAFVPIPPPQRQGYSGSWSRGGAAKVRTLEAPAPVEEQAAEEVADEAPAEGGEAILEQEEDGDDAIADLLTPDDDSSPNEQ